MALQKQYLDLFYGISGISQKPDPKVLESPQMAVIENAICERPGRLELRPGYRTEIMPSSDGPAYEPYRIALRDKRPVAFTQNRGKITEYVNETAEDYDADDWHTIETERHARSSERTIYSFQDYHPFHVDSIIVGDYLFVSCTTRIAKYNSSDPGQLLLLVFDKNTYQYLKTHVIYSNPTYLNKHCKTKLILSPSDDETEFYLAYTIFSSGSTYYTLYFARYDVSALTLGSSFASQQIVPPWFDIVVYVYSSSHHIYYIYLDYPGLYPTVAKVDVDSPYTVTTLSISTLGYGSSNSIGAVAIGINTAADTLGFLFETTAGIYLGFCPISLSSLTTSYLLLAASENFDFYRATITYNQKWYILYEANDATHFDLNYIRSFNYTSDVFNSLDYHSIKLLHRATPYDEEAGSQYGYYVGLLDDDESEGTNYTAVGIIEDYDSITGSNEMKLAPIAQFQTYIAGGTDDVDTTLCDFVTRINLIETGRYKWVGVAFQSFVATGEFGLVVNEVDLTTDKLMQPFNYQRLLFLASSMPHEYDGSNIGDIGLIPRPVILSHTVVNNSSRPQYLGAGDYFYKVVFERRDAYGNLYRSRPSLAYAVTIGAETYPTVELIIDPFVGNFYTGDRSWRAILYRTKEGPANIYYQTLIDDSTSDYDDDQSYRRQTQIVMADTLSDASLEEQNFLYTTGGVLENYACPPTNYITKHQSRIWAINSANGDIWYSKELITGEGPAFSPAFVVSNPEADIPEAIQSLNETALVVFWPHKIGIIYGEGPNDLGQGGSYTVPQMLPGNVGAIDWRSVIKTEIGVFFQSAKGIYLLPLDSGRAQYIGAGVELYRDSTIYSADVIENRHQVRLLAENYTTSSNRDILIYDYLIQQWHIWPDVMSEAGGIIDSIDYNGAHALLHADGISVQDSDWSNSISPYTDYYDYSAANGPSVYAMKVVTPWVKLAGLQGFQRVWRVLILGEYTEYSHSHDLTVELYYDYVENDYAKDTVSIPWATIQQSAANNFLYQFRVGVPHQRCEAIKVKVTVSQYDEENPKRMVTLTGLRFEYGIMPRSMRLPKYPPVG